jgi:hypothetical protein
MAINVQTQIKASPATDIPGLIMPFSQPSGAFLAISNGAPEVRLGDEDQYVYVKRLDIRTATIGGQSSSNQFPGVDIDATMVSTPTYLLRNSVEFDHHESNRAGMWGFPVDQAYVLGMNQGFFQQMRVANLYGMTPSNGEGLLNTNGASATNLPVDQFNNSTFSTYDNGSMYSYILELARQVMAQTYQFGVEQRMTILGPTRVISRWQTSVVQLTNFQREGAGTATIASAIKAVLKESGVTVEFGYDDTMIGKGSGGKDAVLICLPDIQVPKMQGNINTNAFAELQPSLTGCNVMYQNVAQPTQKRVPLAKGFQEIMSEIRITSGWGLRPEAIMILSGTY